MSSPNKNTFNKSRLPSNPENSGPRTYNIKISLTAIITVSVLFLICFGWSFLLGVMVGRDYDPETLIPQFTGQSSENTNAQIEAQGDGALGNEIIQFTDVESESIEMAKESEEDKIIKIEELNFASSLKGKPGEGKLAITTKIKQEPKNVDKASDNISTGMAKNEPASKDNKSNSAITTSNPKMPTQKTNVEQAVEPKPIYDFVLQVATFKDADAVDKVREELEGYNLRTRMIKWQGEKNTFYSVLVVFRGTEKNARDLDKIFKKLRLGQAIQKEKTLVES